MSPAPASSWRKSRRSMSNGACTEVAAVPGGVAVRDSRDPDRTLAFPVAAWDRFTAALRARGDA